MRSHYASTRDQIENGYDPHATIRAAVRDGSITRVSLDEAAAALLDNYVEVNAEEGMTAENADLTERDFRDYITELFEEYAPRTVVRVTSAPEAYDGFGTETVEALGELGTGGRTYRRVRVIEEHEAWQRGRYLSGLYVCLSEADFNEWTELGLI